jgi:DnaJ like chaperone protein
MSLTEIAVIIFGLFAGYWVVGRLFFRSPKNGAGSTPPPSTPASPSRTAPPWYDVLQVAQTAPPGEIEAAYKRLISQYHPDKVDTLGQELKDLATQKSQQISAAYREALAYLEALKAHGTTP